MEISSSFPMPIDLIPVDLQRQTQHNQQKLASDAMGGALLRLAA
ncbi:hypothetical protein [Xaviernesmea oryzae]|nr:hypothetical protein [Xaviernesmea oryzae]